MAQNNNGLEIYRSSKNVVKEAILLIKKYQSGELRPARTGYDYLDRVNMGGLYPQNIVAIGGRAGTGKSYFLQKIMNNVMDIKLNPQSRNYMLLRCEFEMTPKDLIARVISETMNKPIEDIFTKAMTSYESKIMDDIANSFMDDRVFYIPFPVSTQDLVYSLRTRFLPAYKDKEMVIVSIDHVALIKRLGQGLKESLDVLLSELNQLKLEFHNVFFLVASQFNRNIEMRTGDKRMHAPLKTDFYGSDELSQYASVMVGLNNPYDMGIDSYMTFSEHRYPWLDRFKWPDKKSFYTRGLIFHHVVKMRQGDLDKFEGLYVDVKPGFERAYREPGQVTYVAAPPAGEIPPPPPPEEPKYVLTGDDLEDIYSRDKEELDSPF